MEYPGGTRQYLKRKNQLSLELAKKARQMNNDAFQPFLSVSQLCLLVITIRILIYTKAFLYFLFKFHRIRTTHHGVL
jgi:hypothetical protein